MRMSKYSSIREWIKDKNIMCPITAIANQRKRDCTLKEFSELRDYLFRRHVASLSEQEQQQFASGTHPSQQQDPEAANQFAVALSHYLKSVGCDCEVIVVFRQGGRLGLGVRLNAENAAIDTLPELYRGFEVAYFT